MKRETVYDIGAKALVERFIKAAARAGASGSGILFDPTHDYNVEEVQYVSGAVLARLEGRVPPLQPGQKVRPKVAHAQHGYHGAAPPKLCTDSVFTVRRCFYDGNGEWSVTLREIGDQDHKGRWHSRYFAKIFEVVPVAQEESASV